MTVSLGSRTERFKVGKALRRKTPREAHADWAPAPDRPDPVSILLAGNQGRQEEFVALRQARDAKLAEALRTIVP